MKDSNQVMDRLTLEEFINLTGLPGDSLLKEFQHHALAYGVVINSVKDSVPIEILRKLVVHYLQDVFPSEKHRYLSEN
jgi:hypothetical protein